MNSTSIRGVLALMVVSSALTGCAMGPTESEPKPDPETLARVRTLVAAARDPDPELRRASVEALANIASPRAVDALIELCADGNPEVRRLAVMGLGRIGSPRALNALLDALRDDEEKVRSAAAAGLAKMPDRRALPAMVEAMSYQDAGPHSDLGKALLNFGNSAVKGLAKSLRRGPRARRSASALLAKMGTPKAMQALESAASDKSWHVRRTVLETMSRMPEAPLDIFANALDDDHAMVRSVAFDALVRRREAHESKAVVTALLKAAEDKNDGIRQKAVASLGTRAGEDRRIRDKLIERLEDGEPRIRREAAAVLARTDDATAAEALAKLIKDQDKATRTYAVRAAARLERPKAIEYLSEAASDSNTQTCGTAMAALATMYVAGAAEGSADADWNGRIIKAIARGLNHQDESARVRAVGFLGATADAEAIASLGESLAKDSSATVRCSAAEALAGIKSARIVPPLAAALEDNDETVRIAAAEALAKSVDAYANSEGERKLAVKALGEALYDTVSQVRAPAVTALGKLRGPDARDALAAAIGDQHADVQLAVVEALDKIGDERAGELLADMLSRSDTARPDVQRKVINAVRILRAKGAVEPLILKLKEEQYAAWAAEALGVIGDPSAVPALLTVLEGESLAGRSAAMYALGRIKDKRAVGKLLALLEDESVSIRAAAAVALGQIGDTSTLPAMLSLADDENSTIRAAAAVALGFLGDERATPSLAILTKDKESFVRTAAMKALGRLQNRDAAQVLLDVLREEPEDPHVRYVAAKALATTDPKAAFRPYVEALPDTLRGTGSRRLASAVLAESGKTDLVEALISALKHSDANVRTFAIWELGYLRDRRAVSAIKVCVRDDDRRAVEAARHALKNLNAPAEP